MQWVRFERAGVAHAGFHNDGEIVAVEGSEVLPLLVGEVDPVETGAARIGGCRLSVFGSGSDFGAGATRRDRMAADAWQVA